MRKLFRNSFILVFLACLSSMGQSFSKSDLELLTQTHFRPPSSTFVSRPFSLTGRNILARYNPVEILAVTSLFFYQNVISEQIGSNCPYHYSCSSFSKMCIARHGLLKGVFLTGDRLTRCGQFGLKDVKYKSDFNSISKRIIDDPSFYD
jgi:uncharacterized protein